MSENNLLQHGIMFAELRTESGFSKMVPVAIGVFSHHGDGFLARMAIGYTRIDAVRSLSDEHNPTEIVHDMDDLSNFAAQLGVDLSDLVGSLPEFSKRMEKEFNAEA